MAYIINEKKLENEGLLSIFGGPDVQHLKL
jgi:hypothetical protein